ncbi:MAG: hypothetical protein WD182_08215 [Bacteroidota bacterium]
MLRNSIAGIASLGLLLLLGATENVVAQQIEVFGGNQTLVINTGAAGSEPVPVVNTANTLQYRRQGVISKITVRTACPTQAFNLSVVATGVVRGIAAPTVDLVNGMAATDFITSIPNFGFFSTTVTLQYTASATFAQGRRNEEGNDVHTVTYTILAQ